MQRLLYFSACCYLSETDALRVNADSNHICIISKRRSCLPEQYVKIYEGAIVNWNVTTFSRGISHDMFASMGIGILHIVVSIIEQT
jgi:hypothetical protein